MTAAKLICVFILCLIPIVQSSPESPAVPAATDDSIVLVQAKHAEQEAKVFKLVSKLNGDASPQAKHQLHAAVEQSFTLQIDLQQRRIGAARKRLDVAEARIKQRIQHRDSILEDRVERLLSKTQLQKPESKAPDKKPNLAIAEMKFIIIDAIKNVEKDLEGKENAYEEFLVTRSFRALDPTNDLDAIKLSTLSASLTELELQQNRIRAKLNVLTGCQAAMNAAIKQGTKSEADQLIASHAQVLVDIFAHEPLKDPTPNSVLRRLNAQTQSLEIQQDSLVKQMKSLELEMRKSASKSQETRIDLVRNDNFRAEIERKRETRRELLQRLKDIQLFETRQNRR